MTYIHRIVQAVEFKDYEVTGPLVDQIVGTSGRIDGELADIFIFCRSANAGARRRAKEHEKVLGIEIVFVEVTEGTP
jgi:hypothetical protein